MSAFLVLGGGYVAIVLALWLRQDAMVFAGAGYPDRGVPAMLRPAEVRWLGEGAERTRLAVVRPEGTPSALVVYFGGNGEDLYATAGTAGVLLGYGVEAWGHEHPGYGASPGQPGVASFLAAAERTIEAAKRRAAELGVPLVVVGSSLGTFCAVHTAARGGVDRLILRAPPTTLVAAAKSRFAWLPVGLLLRHRFDNLARAPEVRCPTLVVHGDRDGIVPIELGRELAAAIAGARFVAVPGRGHNDLDLGPGGPVDGEVRQLLSGR
ncbi:MAG: alpha/beta hydrolase [Planctomycetes bacterium]|nr:alpha/beta hydrolase [Planctomycetota bacterium]